MGTGHGQVDRSLTFLHMNLHILYDKKYGKSVCLLAHLLTCWCPLHLCLSPHPCSCCVCWSKRQVGQHVCIISPAHPSLSPYPCGQCIWLVVVKRAGDTSASSACFIYVSSCWDPAVLGGCHLPVTCHICKCTRTLCKTKTHKSVCEGGKEE